MVRDFFIKYRLKPDYKDVENLKKFLDFRMNITSREENGLTAKIQRKLQKHIKYARYLGLIPYTSYQNVK